MKYHCAAEITGLQILCLQVSHPQDFDVFFFQWNEIDKQKWQFPPVLNHIAIGVAGVWAFHSATNISEYFNV